MTGAGLFIVLGFCVLQYLAVPQTHHFVLHKNGFDVPQDIIADVQENYAILVIGKVDGCDWCNAIVNFHDFNTGHSSINRRFVANEFPGTMTKSEVELLAGPRIADFCQDYTVKRIELTFCQETYERLVRRVIPAYPPKVLGQIGGFDDLKTYANSLDPDHAHNAWGLTMDPNSLTLGVYI